MNLVKATANKVMELEKRLDNENVQEYMNVFESSKTFETTTLITTNSYLIATLNGSSVSSPNIIQGEVKIRVFSETNVKIKLFLDGYEVLNRASTYAVGAYTINLLKAVDVAPTKEQKLTMEISLKGGGEAEIQYYTFFVWGYGDSLNSSFKADTEPKLYGYESDDGCYLYLILDENVFYSKTDGFKEDLSGADFVFKRMGKCIAPIIKKETIINEDGTSTESSSLINFFVDEKGDLYEIYGEDILNLSDATFIRGDFSCVSVCEDGVTQELVVVYSVKNKLYYFVKTNDTRTEEQEIFSFNEDILDVSLIQNCETTTFLAVSLTSGKNYLFSSVTVVDEEVKESKLKIALSVEFV